MNHTNNASKIKERASGRWLEILASVARIDSSLLDGAHHPCPKCGGKDRFRMIDDADGSVLCNQCFRNHNGDGLAAVQWALGCDLSTAIDQVTDYLGNGKPKRQRVSARRRLNRHASPSKPVKFKLKHLRSVGARKVGGSIKVPAYSADGQRCTTLTIWPNATDKLRKGLLDKGKPAGVFLPYVDGKPRLPQPGEDWAIVEGPKDTAALHRLGFLAVGLPTCQMNAKFSSMFQGCRVTIIPDLDTAGSEGSKKTAGRLRGVAESVTIARLPGEIKESGGDDVRDVLARAGGEQLLRKAIRNAREVDEDGNLSESIRFDIVTAPELDRTEFDITYLVEDVLAAEHVAGIVGPSKSLKTNIACDLALSLATRGRFLGYFKTTRACRTLFMSGESGMPTIQETLRRIARASGGRLEDADRLLVSGDLPHFGNVRHVKELGRLLKSEGVDVLFVDPLYLCLDPDGRESSLFAMGAHLRPVAEVCQENGTTLVMIHHSTQSSVREGGLPKLEDSSWAGTQQFFRQWIALKRAEPYDPDQAGHHELFMVTGGSMGHSSGVALTIDEGNRTDPGGRRWDVDVSTIGEAINNQRNESQKRRRVMREQEHLEAVDECRESIRNILADGKPDTKTSIAQRCGHRGVAFDGAVQQMIDDGELIKTTMRKANKQSYQGYKLCH